MKSIKNLLILFKFLNQQDLIEYEQRNKNYSDIEIPTTSNSTVAFGDHTRKTNRVTEYKNSLTVLTHVQFEQDGRLIGINVASIKCGTIHICTYYKTGEEWVQKQKCTLWIPRIGTFSYQFLNIPINKGDILAYSIEDASIISYNESIDSHYCLLFNGISSQLKKENFLNYSERDYPIQVVIKSIPIEDEKEVLLEAIKSNVLKQKENDGRKRIHIENILKKLMTNYAIFSGRLDSLDVDDTNIQKLAEGLNVTPKYITEKLFEFFKQK